MASPLKQCHFLVHLQTHQHLDLSCHADAHSQLVQKTPAQAGVTWDELLSDDSLMTCDSHITSHHHSWHTWVLAQSWSCNNKLTTPVLHSCSSRSDLRRSDQRCMGQSLSWGRQCCSFSLGRKFPFLDEQHLTALRALSSGTGGRASWQIWIPHYGPSIILKLGSYLKTLLKGERLLSCGFRGEGIVTASQFSDTTSQHGGETTASPPPSFQLAPSLTLALLPLKQIGEVPWGSSYGDTKWVGRSHPRSSESPERKCRSRALD